MPIKTDEFTDAWKALNKAKKTDLKLTNEAVEKLANLALHPKIKALGVEIDDLARLSGIPDRADLRLQSVRASVHKTR